MRELKWMADGHTQDRQERAAESLMGLGDMRSAFES